VFNRRYAAERSAHDVIDDASGDVFDFTGTCPTSFFFLFSFSLSFCRFDLLSVLSEIFCSGDVVGGPTIVFGCT